MHYPLTAVHPTRNSIASAVHTDFARFILPTETRFDHMWVLCRVYGALLSQFWHVLVVWTADVGADGPVVCAPAPFAGSIEKFSCIFDDDAALQFNAVESRNAGSRSEVNMICARNIAVLFVIHCARLFRGPRLT
jgi:hypothetical protein